MEVGTFKLNFPVNVKVLGHAPVKAALSTLIVKFEIDNEAIVGLTDGVLVATVPADEVLVTVGVFPLTTSI